MSRARRQVASVRRWLPADLPAIRWIMETSLAVDALPGFSMDTVERAIARLPIDPDGTAVALEGRRVVGYCTPRMDDITVHPDHRRRGHGRRLVEEARRIVGERGRRHLQLYGPHHLPAAREFIGALGFRYNSSLWRLELDPSIDVPPASFAPDVTVRPIARDEDLDRFVGLLNDTFADHPTPLSWTVDAVRHVNSLPDFDPAGVLVVSPADRPEELVAFARAELDHGPDGSIEGSVSLIGVRTAWRGRGLGRELLRWGIGHVRARGAGTVHLSVEALNERATRIYRAAGFVPTIEWPHYVLDALPPVSSSASAVSVNASDPAAGAESELVASDSVASVPSGGVAPRR